VDDAEEAFVGGHVVRVESEVGCGVSAGWAALSRAWVVAEVGAFAVLAAFLAVVYFGVAVPRVLARWP
jgi:hypothetical protein